MPDQQLHLFQDWGPQNERDRQVGKEAIRAIKGNLRSMGTGDPRFMGTEQRKRMGAESSHMGMIESGDKGSQPTGWASAPCGYCGTVHHPDDPAGCGY